MENIDTAMYEVEEFVVPKSFDQLGILNLDGSGSMKEDAASGNQNKGQAVNTATKGLFSRMESSSMNENFSMGIITFDHQAKVHTDATPMTQIDSLADYNPLNGHGGGTDIGKALETAEPLIQKHLDKGKYEENEGIPHSVVLLVLSDGESSGDPVAIANTLKQKYGSDLKICTVMFATKGHPHPRAEEILQQIATTPDCYTMVYNAEQLRKFFIASMSAGKNMGVDS